jgi:8-amino-7-oxononanoate synthase
MSAPAPDSRSLASQMKERLLRKAMESRIKRLEEVETRSATGSFVAPKDHGIHPDNAQWEKIPGFQKFSLLLHGAKKLGIKTPFFTCHEGTAGATTVVDGRRMINFSNYNYLGLSGHPEVNEGAKEAIERYGTSVSASRIVAGERPPHRELEKALADLHRSEASVVFVSGHATSVTVIGHLFGPKDLIVHDALIHNSIVEGIRLSGAKRLSFPHNDHVALDGILSEARRHHERVLVVVEGIYSMDGDFPDLPEFVAVKRKHHALLMVDEAHSIGVMGSTGRGIAEHFDMDATDVDLWMGTLSKSLASCGGYVAGSASLMEYLKHSVPGFVYSVGMPPASCAAALVALRIMLREPGRVAMLGQRGRQFLEQARSAGIPTGSSAGLSVIPAITGSSIRAARISQELAEQGISAQPILYPAVSENAARIRFFISSDHSEKDIESTVGILTRLWKRG